MTAAAGKREWRQAGFLLGGMTIFVAAAAYFLEEPVPVKAGLATTFLLLSAGLLLSASRRWLELLREWVGRGNVRWWLAAGIFAALVPTYWARGQLADLPLAAFYIAIPVLITADRPRRSRALARDVAIVLLLWLPLEFALVPGEVVALRLAGLDILFLLYALERPLFEPGRLVTVKRIEWAWGFGAWLVFLMFAIPVALATGFAQPGLSPTPWVQQLLSLVLLFWLTALPEEALFRGVIQGLIEKASRPWIALIAASLIFGLAHFPDWRYILLASFAGAAYGLAFLRTGNLAAPILTHFLVDATWRLFFYPGSN